MTPDLVPVVVDCCVFLNQFGLATLVLLLVAVVAANVGEWTKGELWKQ